MKDRMLELELVLKVLKKVASTAVSMVGTMVGTKVVEMDGKLVEMWDDCLAGMWVAEMAEKLVGESDLTRVCLKVA